MANPVWTVTLDDGPHTVEVDGRGRTIKVLLDGMPQHVFKKPFIDVGGDYPFALGRHHAMIHSRTNGVTARYDLSINGSSVTTRQPVTLIGATPPWAWVFVVACAIIPIISLGGALPAVLGSGGGIGTYMLAKKSDLPMGARVAGCLAITVVCWLLFWGLLSLVGRAR